MRSMWWSVAALAAVKAQSEHTYYLTAADWIPSPATHPARLATGNRTPIQMRRSPGYNTGAALPPTPTGPPRLLPKDPTLSVDPDRLCASPRLPSSWPEGRSDSRIIAALNASPAVVYWVRKQPVEEPSRR